MTVKNNQTTAVTQTIGAVKQSAGINNNEHDVKIVEKIVEGTITQSKNESTTAQEIAKVESEKVTEIAEMEKERAIEVTKIENDTKIKVTELESEKALNIAKIEDDTKRQIAEWEHEAKMRLLGINERIDERKAELDAKVKMTEHITESIKWVTGVAAAAAVLIINTGATKEIQLEKIRQGQID